MNKNEGYFGIKFNKDIPKVDKVNKYNKEVELNFEGSAYLVVKKNDEIEKIEIADKYKLLKEGEYEIEFTNLEDKTYNLKLKIKTFGIFWIFLLAFFMIACMFYKNIMFQNYSLDRFYDYINLAVIKVEGNENQEYEFDVNFENIEPEDINLVNTINAKSLAKNKIAPRSRWAVFNINKH